MTIRKLLVLLLLLAVPLLSIPATFGDNYGTTTNPSSSAQTISVSTTFTNDGAGASNCANTAASFNATKGQMLLGSITANQPNTLTVRILTDSQASAWNATNGCSPDQAQGSVWQSGSQVTIANLKWTAPQTGTYWLLMQTYSAVPVVVVMNLYSQG